MPLNKATGNMYDWITHTWNPVKGRCSHDCSYCYMKKWGEQKSIHLDERELRTDLGSGNTIFIGSSCDMFAADVPSDWIWITLSKATMYRNNYLLQSKNPGRFLQFSPLMSDPVKVTFCTTIETNWYFPGISNAPRHFDRAEAMRTLHDCGFTTMVTIEPIIDFEVHALSELIKRCNPSQVNIGADSGKNGLPEPPAWKINALVELIGGYTTVRKKKNLARILRGDAV